MTYKDEIHSKDCSRIIRKAAIWFVHDLFLLKPIGWSLNIVPIAVLRHWQMILPGTESIVMPVSLDQSVNY